MKNIIKSRIDELEIRIIPAFKVEIRRETKWDTGYHILDYINTRQAFEYGRLLGSRDCLKELLHLINNTPTIDGEKDKRRSKRKWQE